MPELSRQSPSDTAPSVPEWALALPIGLLWILSWYVGGTGPDRTILVGAYAAEQPWLQLALFVTRLGDWEILVGLTFVGAAWLLLRRQWRTAFVLIGSTLAGRLMVGIQKAVLGVIRPAENEHLVQVQSLSFPSGHAANSMIVYLTLAVLLVSDPKRRRVAVAGAVLLSLLIGISRVTLGVHWPSDVVGGWSFGLLWVLLLGFVERRFGRQLPS